MKTNSCWSKMACGNMYACVCIILLISFIEGCEGPVDLLCHKNDDCIDGYLCNSESKCVKSDTPDTPNLSFVTEIVKTAIIGGNYSDPPAQLIEVQGGLSPKRWALKIDNANMAYLDWLEIDVNSGLLRNVQGKSPKTVTSTASFTVEVTDSSNVGQGLTISKKYTMVIKECVGPTPCYGNKSNPYGVCFLGMQQCVAEKLGICVPGDQTSSDPYNCGSTCGQCQLNIADNCLNGVCSCGSKSACDSSSVTQDYEERCCNKSCVNVMTGDPNNCGKCSSQPCAGTTPGCCGGKCVDMASDVSNCGDCGNICTFTHSGCCKGTCVDFSSLEYCGSCDKNCKNDVVNVPEAQIVCNYNNQDQNSSTCGYTGNCSTNYLDCDGNTTPGCETPINTNNCGMCNSKCLDTYTCTNEACSCNGATNGGCTCQEFLPCPLDSNAPNLYNIPGSPGCKCICNHYRENDHVPCPAGLFCCYNKNLKNYGCCTKECTSDNNSCVLD